MEDVWCDVIGCVMCVVQYDFYIEQVQVVGECVFVEFNVVVSGIFDMMGMV